MLSRITSRLDARKLRTLTLLSALMLMFATEIQAQVGEGVITGFVRDGTGAVLSKTRVTLHNVDSGIDTVTSTDGVGLFVSPPLNPGFYDVIVAPDGFKKEIRHVRLDVAERVAADVVLSVGASSEIVEVTAATVQLEDTGTAAISNIRDEAAVHDLPLNGRNFAELLGLGAGVVPGQTQQGSAGSGASSVTLTAQRGPTSYTMNGQRMTDNRLLLDGIGDNENHGGGGIIYFPPIDAIEEFREETTDADARYGRASGGIINMVFKSGTSNYHGEVFDFIRNSALDAKNYFDKNKPAFRLNNFGGTFSGPLFHKENPKTFFFADYAGQRESQGFTNLDTVPAWGPSGVGDFSLYSTKVKDPATGTAFTGNVIPANYLTSTAATVGVNILKLFSQYDVTPNVAGTTTANNYRYIGQHIDDSNAFDARVDRDFTTNDKGFVRISRSYNNINWPGLLPSPLVGAQVSGPAQEAAYHSVISETHIFSPTLLNTASVGWARIFIYNQNFDKGLNIATQLGIPGVIISSDVSDTDGFPALTISGLTSIGDPDNAPSQIGTNNYQVNDNVSLVRGKHSFDFGGELDRLQYNMYITLAEHGTMKFTGNFSGQGLSDLLLGLPTSGTYQYQKGTRGFRQLDLAFYAQDSYRASNRLTLNVGVRYDNFLGWPWTEVNDRMYQFEPTISATKIFRVGTNGISRSGVNGNNTNFSPRVGLAYRLTSSTVLHGAYGLYYASPSINNFSSLPMNAPNIDYTAFNNTSYSTVAGAFHFLSDGFTHNGVSLPTSYTTPAGSPPLPLYSVDPHDKTQYAEQWHLSIEQLIGSRTKLTFAYVANNGIHLPGTFDINQATPGSTALATRRPYSTFAQILQLQNRLISHYNGLQVSADHTSRDLDVHVNYTYSHALDENSSSIGVVVNGYNLKADYGNSDQNIPNRFVGSVTYRLPFTGSGSWKPVVSGWQLNAILSYYDGIPFSVTTLTNGLNISQTTTVRANLAAGEGNGSLPSNKRTLAKWFNTSVFSNPNTRNWSDYNSGRNILQGPGTKQADLSVFKNFTLRDRTNLQLRSEFFNVFNTPQFNNPNPTLGTGFGTVSSAGSPQTLQRLSREIQLAAKISF